MIDEKNEIVVALAGNPNSGKTTIFNNLTGARQHVGNYPGVTVETKEGLCHIDGINAKIVDLPGIYSLTAYSMEELVARNYILEEKPDVVVDIIDASNLERNLYLAVQIMELGVPAILVFNMSDIAHARGIEFDLDKLSSMFSVPIIETTGIRAEGMDKLKEAIVSLARRESCVMPAQVRYGKEIERCIKHVRKLLDDRVQGTEHEQRWTAVKLLENDKELLKKYQDEEVTQTVNRCQHRLEAVFGDHPEILIADRRYGFISGACQEAVRSTVEARHNLSDRIDEILTNKVLGIPIFLAMMYFTFYLTFTIGSPLTEGLGRLFDALGAWIASFWPASSPSLIKSLLIDGVIQGVGGVLQFMPNILLLFMAIAFLEDSGYMARAAFLMDRIMHKIGLHGKSFIPMLIGFGCTVPAVMAARTLENQRDRMTTILILPLMSCSARLVIYSLLIPAFFPPALHAPMMWLIYMTGVGLAILCARLLRGFVFRGKQAPFVMELPIYRMPTWKGVLIHMWERSWLYIKKAGTIILGFAILFWVLTTFPRIPAGHPDADDPVRRIEYTVAGRIGHTLEPVIRPLGFDWRIGTAMIGAFAAKELFLTQLGIVHSVGDHDEARELLREKLGRRYSPLTGFCVMLFMLIGLPCMATVAITRKETGSWAWAAGQLAGLTLLAYVVTLVVYQVGSLMGL